MSNYNITIFKNEKAKTIQGRIGDSLLSALLEHGIYINATCGGKGCCGKCGVIMICGATGIEEADQQFFSEEQLNLGMRLACVSFPTTDCSISIIGDDEEVDFEVVANYQGEKVDKDIRREKNINTQKLYNIAIDIGTTTLALCIADDTQGEICDTVTSINHQRIYGADVISRIQAANEGKLSELTNSIHKDLNKGMKRLFDETGIAPIQIGQIVVAGNTTMEHLFMGFSCKTLGVYPFEPVDISMIRTDFSSFHTTLLPGISTFVGADIVSGLFYCGFDQSEQINILIDLGTNGEMAIGNKDKILVTSTAVGPAFEGGNISCGIGSVQGAISSVEINGREILFETIGEKDDPLGICGTGVIEMTYELLKEGWIDETGMLDEDYVDDGFVLTETSDRRVIAFSQKDVREIQLAKSAVRAGLEVLLLRYGVTYEDINSVFLAGGFGYRMNLKKATGIGMLPVEMIDKTIAVGNSSLGGCVKYLTDDNSVEQIERIIQVSEEISLASDKDFNNFYTKYMFFE